MKAIVIDASVIAAGLLRERNAAEAAKLLESSAELLAPDLLYAELGNVLWKRHRRGELSEAEAAELMSDVLRLPLITTPAQALAADAVRLAVRVRQTVYDCLYLALAVRHAAVLVTADSRLVNGLAATPLQRHIRPLCGRR